MSIIKDEDLYNRLHAHPMEPSSHDRSPSGLLLHVQQSDARLSHRSNVALEEDVCIHIFGVSAGMVGVCVTVIGLLRVAFTIDKINTLADDLLAGDALVFLFACVTSYWALRTRSQQRMHQVERIADLLFLMGLVIIVGVCVLL